MGDDNLDDLFADYDALISDTGNNDENRVDGTQDAEENTSQNNPVVRRRIVRNPRPKLNADRLCGERGIPGIQKHFEKVSFKGKGYEKEDLNKLLSTLEHWAHRLFPSLKFAECLTHIEKLGRKKPVQVCARKIRMDMPILAEDFVNDAEEAEIHRQSEDDDDVHRQQEIETSVFDQLIEDHQRKASQVSLPADEFEIHNPCLSTTADANRSITEVLTEDNELSEEQKRRIERNKKLAAERRKARLAKSNPVANTSKEIAGTSSKDSESEMCIEDIYSLQSSTALAEVTCKASENNDPENVDHGLEKRMYSFMEDETSVNIVTLDDDTLFGSTEDQLFSQKNVSEEHFASSSVEVNNQQKLTKHELLSHTAVVEENKANALIDEIQQELTEEQMLSELSMEEESIIPCQ